MDAIIGRYKVRIEETGLILKHPSGISFDFLPNEVLGALEFHRLLPRATIGHTAWHKAPARGN